MSAGLAGGQGGRNAGRASTNNNHVKIKSFLNVGNGVGRNKERRQPCAFVARDNRGFGRVTRRNIILFLFTWRATRQSSCASDCRSYACKPNKASTRNILHCFFHWKTFPFLALSSTPFKQCEPMR